MNPWPVPLDYGSGNSSFLQWLSSCVAYFLLKIHLHQSSKITSHGEVAKLFFVIFWLIYRRLRTRIRIQKIIWDPDPGLGGPKTYSLWIRKTGSRLHTVGLFFLLILCQSALNWSAAKQCNYCTRIWGLVYIQRRSCPQSTYLYKRWNRYWVH